MIDECFTAYDMAYSDDDLETLLLHTRAQLYAFEHGTVTGSSGEVIDQASRAEKVRKELRFLEHMRSNGIPDAKQDRIARYAFRVRALNEIMRIQLMQTDRSKALAGYSPFVMCSSLSWSEAGGFQGGPILWDLTVQAAVASADTSEIAPWSLLGAA